MFSPVVNTSKSFNFSPSAGEIIINAYGRIQVRRTEILAAHMQDAVMELNLLLAGRFANMGPNLWTVDLQSIPLVQGSATYSIPAETIQVLDCFIRYGSPSTDRIMFPISRTEYASAPNKLSQGFPSQFWFDRLISPTITFYLTPDGNGPYTAYYYRIRQVQDATIANGFNIEVVYRFLDALTAGLSHRLARIYKPELEMIRKADAEEAWNIAAKEDTENVPMYVVPQVGGYWR